MLAEPMELPAETVHGGVSSFGIGGTNCHMVLASAPATEPAPPSSGGGVLTMSADSPESLRHNALQLADDIENSDAPSQRRELVGCQLVRARKTVHSSIPINLRIWRATARP